MKKSLTLLIVGLTIIGSGLFIGSSLFSKNETTEQTPTSTTKEIPPELFLETEVLDTKKSETISSVNELYQGDLSFEHANPEKTYLLSIQLLDKKIMNM